MVIAWIVPDARLSEDNNEQCCKIASEYPAAYCYIKNNANVFERPVVAKQVICKKGQTIRHV